MPKFSDRLRHAWSAFNGRDRPPGNALGPGAASRPDKPYRRVINDKSIVTAIENRIAIDVAAIGIQHVRTDQNGRYVETIYSGLNRALTVEANIDQSGRAFVQDLVMTMLDDGVAAAIPVETDLDPRFSSSYDIRQLRVGQIVEWFPRHVKVRLYNDRSGFREELVLPKRMVAIIQNPLYAVMNEPNSTLQRLMRKLNLMDSIDEQTSAGKLDLMS